MKILLFGAGSTGRGHLGALLYENGFTDITFVDRKKELVAALNDSNGYKVRLLGENERTVDVKNVVFIGRDEESKIIDVFCEADLVLTAVIAENLENISEILAKAIIERKLRGNSGFTNIIACENLDNATDYLKQMTFLRLNDAEKAYADKCVGFPDAMISRVVPLAKERPDYLIAEDYNEWVVRRSDFKGDDPYIPCIDLVDNLEARLERKLWIHNGGHATVAYAGRLKGYRYIHEAVFDAEVAAFAGKVLDELGDIVIRKHGFPVDEIREYEAELGKRGAIVEMMDDIARVIRDPIRKLGYRDRLMAPAIYAQEHGLRNGGIIESLANITLYYSPTDPESVRMKNIIETSGIRIFLEETIGIKQYPEIIEGIIRAREAKSR